SLRTRAPIFLIGDAPHTSEHLIDYILINASIAQETKPDTTGFEQISSGFNILVYRALDTIETETIQVRYEFDGTTPGIGWYSPTFTEDGLTYQWMSDPVA